ncbi:hypothetical protein FSP39_019138 [Pinctada imbricata]|uniref:MAGUK p55 subfamily member 7 n=1 Tax=Pinctada imbricata TaxID=66713 RepID=A0AA88XDQ6_PINIB|nr:hypothetical protein FSP39_019138 [Pinctada imbricata]
MSKMCQPIRALGGHICLPFGIKNTNLVEDIEFLLPVRFGEIPCSGCRGDVKNIKSLRRTDDDGRRTDDGRRAMTITHLSFAQLLPELSARLNISDADEVYIRRFFRKKDIQLIMKVFCDIRRSDTSSVADKLIQLLSRPHFQALLYAHDKVATHDYDEHIKAANQENGGDMVEEKIRIVQLIKRNEPLGVTIQRKDHTGTIEIARILHGGAAYRSGLVNVGDEIHEVNGIHFVGRDPNEIAQLLARLSGPVTMKLRPNIADGINRRISNVRVRCLFDYNPFEDPLTPCPHAGLSFRKGDILHIVSQDDPLWWQAHQERGVNSKSGLIPSRMLQERREILVKSNKEDGSGKRRRSRSLSPCRLSPRIPRSRRVRKMMYQAANNSEYEHGDIPTYEEVELLSPNINAPRPIVLIGAPNVGRNELKRRLIAWNPRHFVDIVPYTSRPKRPEEEEGREYHFVTRREMESGILARRFVEHGEFKGNLYGTRADSIQSAINSGRVCILTPSAKALPYLRTSDIKPYIIFICAPPLAKMKETRRKYDAMVTSDKGETFLFTDEELSAVVAKSSKIEAQYSHLFDKMIINDDLQWTLKELINITKTLETEPFWVPVTWT